MSLGVLFLAFALPFPARADTLLLRNGDSLRGHLAREEAGAWIWLSPLLGEIRVPRDSVLELRPDPPPETTPREPGALAPDMSTLTTNRLISADVSSSTEETNPSNPFPKKLTLSKVQLDLAVEDSAGNDNRTRQVFALNSRFRHQRNRHFVQADYDVEDRDEARTTDEWSAGYKYNYILRGPWLGYLSALSEEDRLSGIDHRLRGSFGPGYEFFDTPTLRWAVETGLAYHNEDYRLDAGRRFWGAHFGMDWRWLIPATGVECFHNHALMQSFDMGTDWEVRTETGLRFRMVGRLTSVLKLQYDYDHLPAEDKSRMDRTWLFGVGYVL